MSENGFFKVSDPSAQEISGYPINQGWWSRRYEYPWAIQYAEQGHGNAVPLRVADMGCGWTPRPFKDALAKACGHVYAVDGNPKILDLPKGPGVEWVVADMTQRIEAIPEGSLDRVFCISVLEDVGDKVSLALKEFKRCIKDEGLIVLTFDVQYDYDKPLGQWPGVVLEKFWRAVEKAGLKAREAVSFDRNGVVVNEEFNLCVMHVVLVKDL